MPVLKKAVEKSYLTIQEHSITVKPSPKHGKMTTEDKSFYARNEFCDYIDDAYLTIGRSQAYRLDFENSKLAFEYVVANYPQDISKYEAQLWLALLALKTGNPAQATFIFQKLDAQKNFPKKLLFLKNAVKTEWAISQKDYPAAQGFLDQALTDFKGTRAQELRMRYLRAQLFEKIGDKKSAYKAYNKLLRAVDISYEMQFNARLAMAYLSEGVGVDKLKKLLMQMSEDPRNKSYVDRIWTVLGKMEWQAGNQAQAIAYYENALNEVNVSNESKLKIYQELLNGYFKAKNYILAYPVLKNMLSLMTPAHPRYTATEALYAKYKNLGENLEIIKNTDSLLRVSQQTDEYKAAWAKDRVEQYLKEKFELERKAALRTETKLEKAQEGQFYFYNKKVLEQGKIEFDKKWGGRRLEDGWRRADQRLASYSDRTMAKMKLSAYVDTSKTKQKQFFPNQTEYYLEMLAKSESNIKDMQSVLAQAYYMAGKSYASI
jgi:tetratricopeptide (TPR) repeat protein